MAKKPFFGKCPLFFASQFQRKTVFSHTGPALRTHRPTDNMSLIETYYLTYMTHTQIYKSWALWGQGDSRTKSYDTCVSWKRTNKANLREPKVSQKGFSAKRNLREPKIEKPIECEALREPKSKPKAKRKAKPWTKLRMAREPKPKTSVKQAWTSRSKPLGRAPMLKAILISQLTSLTQGKQTASEANDVCFTSWHLSHKSTFTYRTTSGKSDQNLDNPVQHTHQSDTFMYRTTSALNVYILATHKWADN